MKIGPYTVHALDAGRFGLDGGAMFGIIPRPLWSRRVTVDSAGRIPLATRCMLLEAADRLVLVDTGIGDKFEEKRRQIFAVDTEAPSLTDRLAERGFAPEDITDVVLTHLHFDHCGGTTRRNGDRFEPVFPRARHFVQRAHWDWALEANLRERASFLQENFVPVQREGLLDLVDGDVEILPGIRVESVSGHTEAQQIVHVDGPEGHLVFVADLFPTSAHLSPVWGMAYDIRPMLTIDEKARFLQQAVRGGWHVFFEHDPSVTVGRIVEGDRGPELTDVVRAG